MGTKALVIFIFHREGSTNTNGEPGKHALVQLSGAPNSTFAQELFEILSDKKKRIDLEQQVRSLPWDEILDYGAGPSQRENPNDDAGLVSGKAMLDDIGNRKSDGLRKLDSAVEWQEVEKVIGGELSEAEFMKAKAPEIGSSPKLLDHPTVNWAYLYVVDFARNRYTTAYRKTYDVIHKNKGRRVILDLDQATKAWLYQVGKYCRQSEGMPLPLNPATQLEDASADESTGSSANP